MEITITESFPYLNWLAVMVATIAYFVLAGLWYSPFLFGNQWRGLIGRDDQEPAPPEVPILVMAFVLTWLSASLMSAVLGPNAEIYYGLVVGLLVGTFFLATGIGVIYLFERRPVRLWLINGGFFIVAYGAMGTIIAAWPW